MKDNKTKGLKEITDNLDSILKKRNGGAVNFRGVHYQILYSCYLILQSFKKNSKTEFIRLEGIEDIDIHTSQSITTDTEYIQLKSSVNKMDAGSFWALGVLQNYMEVYNTNPDCKFKLVYNMKIADGNLSAFVNRKQGEDISKFWTEKLKPLTKIQNFNDFADKISFDKQTANELYSKIEILLFKEWNVNKGTEYQFLSALFYNILLWSKERVTVYKNDVQVLFQSVIDSYSKAPINKAIQNNWLFQVSYLDNEKQADDYYDGKAARPIHIVKGLPIRRRLWERNIEHAIQSSDVTVIRASSGQGKSTLAWQTGYNLKGLYCVYQLSNCKNADEANAIAEFLDSRIVIGETPLVVIDGLDSLVQAWTQVVEKTVDIPVKYLITTRQEDWFRFGADISRINITPIDISLSTQEARDVFEQFKKKKKIHRDIIEWQPFWEQVMDKGLLIEYTFLLTKGQMIYERLSSQISSLNRSESAEAKIEILRMVSLADCMNIKLETSRLLAYIKSEIGFQQDRGLMLKELEKEYFLNFNNRFVEGLHPVRSSHLKELLHSHLPLEDSLITLFKILGEEYKNDFFVNCPILLSDENKNNFYSELAVLLSQSDITDMVFALDGIMHGEPQGYWLANKEVFDNVFDSGGIELFSMVSTPFSQLDTLSELAGIMGEKGTVFQQLAELRNKLSVYSFDRTDIVLFANALKNKLAKRNSPINSYQGLEFLCKWYKELKISLKLPFIVDNLTINDLIQMEIQEAKEYMLYFQLTNPTIFNDFINDNKALLLSYLKANTNSLTLEETDGNININYLLFDSEADKANELSVSRIQVVHAFLPLYEKYCTEAILLPFPSEQIISVVRQNSIKQLTQEAIGNMFNAHLNKIWLSTIQKNYQATSAFEWQKNIIGIREIAIDWAKHIIKLVDSLLEGNQSKKEKALAFIDSVRATLSDRLLKKRTYPKYDKKYFAIEKFKAEEKQIDEWFFSLGNTNGQLLSIFIPKDPHDRHIALINLKAVYYNRKIMQEAFRKIEEETVPYFDSEQICKQEDQYFERLYATVQYYLSQLPLESKQAVHVARKEVEQWWLEAKNKELNKLKSILNVIEDDSSYEFILPTSLEETETLTYATFGIINFDFSDESTFTQLSMDLSLLANLDIDFFSIISVREGVATGGLRFRKDYFEACFKQQKGEEDIDFNAIAPLPIYIEQKTIATLKKTSLPAINSVNKDKENAVKILFEIWKLCEHRNRLNINLELEKKWLETVELDCKNAIGKLINSSGPQSSDDLRSFTASVLESNVTYSKAEIMNKLTQTLMRQ
ncbi:hypothetical protein [Sphingobacterium sp.]|uniref:hypothetical protein n=1 Tax=Sphingobacterium sp. TaxID=341027 RepID=UPI0031E01BCA